MPDRLNVTNPTKSTINVGGIDIAPGGSAVVPKSQVPEAYRRWSTLVKDAPKNQDLFVRSLTYAELLEQDEPSEELIFRVIDRPGRPLCRLVDSDVSWMVEGKENPVTGGIGIIGPDGRQVAGNAAPYSFTSRQLADTDNGMNLVCATAQTATVNADLPVGFGCSFEGAISFTAGDGVTITDLRTTGSTDIFCGLMQTGANAYKVRGGKA